MYKLKIVNYKLFKIITFKFLFEKRLLYNINLNIFEKIFF